MTTNIHQRDFESDDVLAAALRYAERGWAVLPLWWRKRDDSCACGNPKCSSPGKHPIGPLVPHSFKDASTDAKVIRSWFKEYPKAGVAMATGAASGVLVLDIDIKNTKTIESSGWASLADLEQELGPLPIDTMLKSRAPSGGRHLFFKHVPGVGSTVEKLGRKLDVKGDGGMIVLPPSAGYCWLNDDAEPEEVPERWVEDLKALIRRPGKPGAKFTTDLDKLAAALEVISNPDFDWDEWVKRGMAIWRATNGSEEGFKLFDEWSQTSSKYNEDRTREKWDEFTRSPPLFIGAGSIFWWADQESDSWRGETKKASKAQKQADVLISLAAAADVFHAPDGTGYADIKVNRHRETWPVKSVGFKRWLLRRYYEDTKSAPNSEAMATAINVIEARAHFEGEACEVYLRVAAVGDDKVYLDLCDDDWRVIEIDKHGWRVSTECPVRFYRRSGMLPLPMPIAGGSAKELRRYINVATTHDFILVIAYLQTALRRGPFPPLILGGEAGAAKSTLVLMAKRLIDPNKCELRSPPHGTRDLFISAGNSYLIAFDNLSYLPIWLSDALCRLATGGGFATRQLYSDDDERLFEGKRPIAFNGIENVVVKGDLADRSIFLSLTRISDEQVLSEDELWAAFERDRPRILGGLLDTVVHGLRMLPTIRARVKEEKIKLSRMADFNIWGMACEGALWREGAFMRAYTRNREKAIADIIDADIVAQAVTQFIKQEGGSWEGESDELLKALNNMVPESQRKSDYWPKASHALSGRLTRAAPALRKIGIDIVDGRDPKTKRRVWALSHRQKPYEPYQPSLGKARKAGKALFGGFTGKAKRFVLPRGRE